MEKIIAYVNNVFNGFPHTEEAARLKMQCIDTLIEKYQTFLSEGKNEHESFGAAIADFGDIEELKKTLSPEQSELHTGTSTAASTGGTAAKPPLDASGIIAVYREIQQTLKHHTRWELGYAALGVGVLIVCTVLTTGLRMMRHTRVSSDISAIGVMIFFICTGFAAAHFLLYALRSLQVEKEIFSLTGKPAAKSTAELFEVLKKDGKPITKKLQGTVIVLMAMLILLVITTGGPAEIAFFILGMGCILYILIGIWLK